MSDNNVEAVGKQIPYLLSALWSLIVGDRITREFRQDRAERHFEANIDLMVKAKAVTEVMIVDSSHNKAEELLGATYLKGRSRVAIVTDPVALLGAIKPPTVWLEVSPIIGREEGEDTDVINDGTHRTASVILFARDLVKQGVDLGFNLDEAEVQVKLYEGENCHIGQGANYGSEKDSTKESFNRLWRQFDRVPLERRAIHKRRFGDKNVQFTWAIYRTAEPDLVVFPRSVSIEDVRKGKKVQYKASDFMDTRGMMGKIPHIDELGQRLKGLAQDSLDYMSTAEEDIPEAVKKRNPFKGTHVRMIELTNCVILDAYKACLDSSIRDQKAFNRPHFSATWQRYMVEGWELQSSTPKAAKPVTNPLAAEAVELLVRDGTEDEKAAGGLIAEMFESGTVNKGLKQIIKDSARALPGTEEFTKALGEALDPEGTNKIQQKTAYKAALKAVLGVIKAHNKALSGA